MPFLTVHGHQRWPTYVVPENGNTARIPTALNLGQPLVKNIIHAVNWRQSGGPVFATVLPCETAKNDLTGAFYIPIHYPARTSATITSRKMAIAMTRWGTTSGGAWTIVPTEDALGTPNVLTGIWQGTGGTASFSNVSTKEGSIVAIIDLECPTGTGGSGFNVLKLTTTNQSLANITCWWAPSPYLHEDQLGVTIPEMGAGRIIKTTTHAQTLNDIHNTAMDAEGVERMTRRAFFNWGHPSGILLGASVGKVNLFGAFTFPARARNLTGDDAVVTSYPVAVISPTRTSGTEDVKLYFDAATSGDAWTYTVQAAEFAAGPLLVTYDQTGASDATGLDVASSADDVITVSASTGANCGLTVHSVGLFEGPAY